MAKAQKQNKVTDEVSSQIRSILANSKSGSEAAVEESASSSDEEIAPKCSDVRGRRAGNRFWKKDRKRFTSLIATRGLKRITFDEKEKLRRELKHAKELSKSKLEERAREKQLQRERRQENLKRREINARKSEIVQVIKNPAKLKRLKKKQLRTIEKRDTSGMV